MLWLCRNPDGSLPGKRQHRTLRTLAPPLCPQDGPGISWAQLRNFQHCEAGGAVDCRIFKDRHPSTIR